MTSLIISREQLLSHRVQLKIICEERSDFQDAMEKFYFILIALGATICTGKFSFSILLFFFVFV